jgi:hypothetical protein
MRRIFSQFKTILIILLIIISIYLISLLSWQLLPIIIVTGAILSIIYYKARKPTSPAKAEFKTYKKDIEPPEPSEPPPQLPSPPQTPAKKPIRKQITSIRSKLGKQE